MSLVDPYNRRPVEYERRSSMLRKIKSLGDRLDLSTMLRRWHDGRLKMFVTWKLLELRRQRTEAIAHGAYQSIDAGSNVCAFTRGGEVLVAVPRFTTSIAKPGAFPLGEVWKTDNLVCPGRWRNLFTAEELDSLPLAKVFGRFPVAVFERV